MSGRIRIRRHGLVALLAAMLVAGCGDRADKPELLLASAKEHLGKGNRNAAMVQLRNALQKNPDLAEARFLLGTSLLEINDVAGADKELRKALELKYPADEIVPALARVHIRRGDYRKVIDEFGGATIAAPAQRADLQTTIGDANLALGNAQAARSAFVVALAAQPDYPRALVGEARLKAVEGDVPGALALVEKTIATSPALTDAWHLKGELLVAQKQIEPALAAYRSALESKADDVPAHHEIVVLLLQAGKAEEARTQFAAMQKVAPKHPQTLYLQALLAFREKDYAAARDAIQLQLKAAPGNLIGLLLGAQIDFRLGSFARAEAALGTALQVAPRNAFARRMLVATYMRDGRPHAAVEALQPLLQAAPKDSDILALAGEVYAHSGDMKAAARYFEEAAVLDPKSGDKRTAAAIAHIAKGERERGLRELASTAAEVSTTGGIQARGAPSRSICSRSRTAASAPSRSALFTTNTSAISRMPAFATWIASPQPGATTTSVVLALVKSAPRRAAITATGSAKPMKRPRSSSRRTPASTHPVLGSCTLPYALTTASAATIRPSSIATPAEPRPPLHAWASPSALPTVAPAPAPTLPWATGPSVAAWHAA